MRISSDPSVTISAFNQDATHETTKVDILELELEEVGDRTPRIELQQ